jgi:dTDP-4-amino-4,6-dideoxygalactose transaminase
VSDSHFIPFHRPSIDQAEIDAVVATLKSGWLTTGPRTAQFETEFKDYVGAPYALAVNSCTAALHLALAALGLGPGDEVITTPLTFCATVNTILQVGATPVLADIASDGNIDPESINKRITSRTRAILPVHYGGAPCDMRPIWELASESDLYVVEDAAHATGTHYNGWPIGAGDPGSGWSSDAVAFSFYATKNLTTGEGGMVTCHRSDLLERMRVLCLHGISKDAWNRYTEKGKWYYEVVECGFKYNLSDIQSAIGIEQLRKQERFLELRAAHARFYNRQFSNVDELEVPQESPYGRHAWHLYSLRLNLQKLSITRSEFIENLRQRGVGASVHFIPIPLHPAFAGRPELAADRCPRAMALYERLVSLPLYPDLSEQEREAVVAAVTAIIRDARKTKQFALPGAAA